MATRSLRYVVTILLTFSVLLGCFCLPAECKFIYFFCFSILILVALLFSHVSALALVGASEVTAHRTTRSPCRPPRICVAITDATLDLQGSLATRTHTLGRTGPND